MWDNNFGTDKACSPRCETGLVSWNLNFQNTDLRTRSDLRDQRGLSDLRERSDLREVSIGTND